jgi:diguanylate cyclase (GGDEF)-like protein/PAS domain S-box-containing protein
MQAVLLVKIEWGYALALLIAALISAIVARHSWKRKAYPGSRPLTVLMLGLTLWCITYALFWLRFLAPTPFFWLDATYLSIAIVPLASLAFTLQLTGRGNFLTRGRLLLLTVQPILILLILWTDPYHGWFFAGKRTPDQGTILDGGPAFYINLAYSYALILISAGLLIQGYLRSKGLYRQQFAALALGISTPLAGNVVSLLGASPFPNLDLTPLLFTVTGLVFSFALFRLGFLDIVPIARHTLVEQMADGLLVLDAQNRVVDINPAAQAFMRVEHESVIGRPANELMAPWPEIRERFADTRSTQQEVVVPDRPDQIIDLRIAPLYDRSGIFNGRLIILRDISERVLIEKRLRQANKELEKQDEENKALHAQLREQAIRDPLTGVFNRRYLEESLVRELARAERNKEALSVAMLDIDSFKQFNDTYGHAAGDDILQALANILTANTRTGDIVCRYGGEEFVVVLPSATSEIALQRINECRKAFEAFRLTVNGNSLQSTVSAGIATFPENGQLSTALLDAADKGLYQAKVKGKNIVVAVEK